MATYYQKGNETIRREEGQLAPLGGGWSVVNPSARPDLYQGQTTLGSPLIPQSITSGNLNSAGTPFTLPQSRPTPTLGANLLGQIESQNDSFTADLAAKTKLQESERDKSLKDYISSLADDKGEITRTSEKYAQEVDPVSVELKDINQKILNEKVGLQRQIEEIEKNTKGRLSGAIEDEVRRARTESLRRQADLSITQMAIQGRYDSAKQIADRAIAAELEQQKQENDIWKTIYEDNKDKFTTAEQRQFETMQRDRERNLNQLEADKKLLSTTKINTMKSAQENGAPLSILQAIQQAETPEATQIAAGQWLQEEKKLNTQVVEVGGRKQLINTQTGQVIKDLGVSEITTTGVSSALGVSDPTGQAYSNAFNNAVIGLPQAAQKIATQTFSNYMSRGDLEGGRAYLVRIATQSLPAADQTQALGRAQATASLKEIEDLLAQAKNQGASTNILTGSLVNISGKLGTSTDPDLAYIGARIQQQLQVYRRSMTGVAFSPQESAEYAKIFPDITNVETLNAAKIKAMTDAFDSNNRAQLSFLLGGEKNYQQIFGKPELPLLPSQQTQGVNPLDQLFSGLDANQLTELLNLLK